MARRGRRADYSWSHAGDEENGQDLGANTGVFASSALAITVPGTIVRIRGKIAAQLDAGAADERAMILVGLTVVRSDYFASGTAPELFSGAPADEGSWLWQGQLFVSSGSEGAVVNDFLVDRIEIDTKAMRKVKSGDSLVLVHQAPAGLVIDQTGTYDLMWYIHCLFAD